MLGQWLEGMLQPSGLALTTGEHLVACSALEKCLASTKVRWGCFCCCFRKIFHNQVVYNKSMLDFLVGHYKGHCVGVC